ncbi:MAG: YraN family protein [Eubacteriaceae bacterium]|nr:YraN family protein [Eubacteriaceae bacterium]
MADNQIKGRYGEQIAVDYLKKTGYQILEKNYRCPLGEVDIIVQKGEDVVFVEVKTRTSDNYGLPGESVISRKQRHIIRSAMYYLAENNDFDRNYRFDVIEVLMNEINHIENAFLMKY